MTSAARASLVTKFQFQPGAIRGAELPREGVCQGLFQFQPGAIRGLLTNSGTPGRAFSFNSSLVRLEGAAQVGKGDVGDMFQFQPGAIRGRRARPPKP